MRGLTGLDCTGNLGRVGRVELHGNGLLSEVRVLIALVDLELGGHLAAELALGQHAFDALLDDSFGTASEQLDEALFAKTAGEAGVTAIELLVALHAGENNLFAVDHDDVIAHVDVGRVEGVQLAGEDGGGDGGEASEGLARGVNDKPLALNVLPAGDGGSVSVSDVAHSAMYSLNLLSSVGGQRGARSGVKHGASCRRRMSRLRGVGAWRVGSGSGWTRKIASSLDSSGTGLPGTGWNGRAGLSALDGARWQRLDGAKPDLTGAFHDSLADTDQADFLVPCLGKKSIADVQRRGCARFKTIVESCQSQRNSCVVRENCDLGRAEFQLWSFLVAGIRFPVS